MKIHVSDELQTTPERAWALYFDREFNRELREVLNVESIEEHEFKDMGDQIKIVFHVVARRNLPDWVRKVVGDVKVGYTSHDLFDRTRNTLETKMVSDVMPNKIKGNGTWVIRPSRPGWVTREYIGDIRIEIPLVGGQMEQKLANAIQHDFALTNELMRRWVQRDLDAIAAGQPLKELTPPQPLRNIY